jgi:hypothetical protein
VALPLAETALCSLDDLAMAAKIRWLCRSFCSATYGWPGYPPTCTQRIPRPRHGNEACPWRCDLTTIDSPCSSPEQSADSPAPARDHQRSLRNLRGRDCGAACISPISSAAGSARACGATWPAHCFRRGVEGFARRHKPPDKRESHEGTPRLQIRAPGLAAP